MAQISIEKYQDSDFKEVISILVSSFEKKFCHRQNLTRNSIENILNSIWDIEAENSSYIHFVAKKDGKVVGVILIRIGKRQKSNKKIPFLNLCYHYGFFNMLFLIFKLFALDRFAVEECYVEHIAVNKCMRGNGVGELLISYTEEVLSGMGFSSLSLVVAESNQAKHLYDRKGFEVIEHINNRFDGYLIGINYWIFMRKNLIKNAK
ncbi:GNAT family N-acetyltransferase [Clostridium saccharoperbutylacetonicum]|uniref:GNAT family N-acetyltransferase n=1 Tax=Clostridium saccharoperbutylacetonicum TaxID=36745 RepID=UPI0039E981DC